MTHRWSEYIIASWDKPGDAQMLTEIDVELSKQFTPDQLLNEYTANDGEMSEAPFMLVQSIVCKYHPETAEALYGDATYQDPEQIGPILFGIAMAVESILEDWAHSLKEGTDGLIL